MEDTQIIQLFWERSESAISETSYKYGSYLHCIAMNILQEREDAAECVNDTYLHTWNAIPPQRPNRLRSWLGRITRNLSLDRYRRGTTQKRGGGQVPLILSELEACIPAKDSVERQLDDKELASLISTFLFQQTEVNRLIFMRRYWYGDSIRQIGERYTLGEGKVKASLFRTRNSLRFFLEKAGVSL